MQFDLEALFGIHSVEGKIKNEKCILQCLELNLYNFTNKRSIHI